MSGESSRLVGLQVHPELRTNAACRRSLIAHGSLLIAHSFPPYFRSIPSVTHGYLAAMASSP